MAGAQRLTGKRAGSVGDAVAADSPSRPPAPLDDLEQLRRSLCAFVAGGFDDPSRVEDVVQETLIRLLSCKCANEHHVRCANGIARHVISDLCRKTRRERRYDPARLDGLNVADNRLGGDPVRRLELEEEFFPVKRAMKDLTARDQYVIDECFLRNRTCAEIARRNGVPAARVRKVKSRALRDLRERLHHPRRS